MSGMTATMIAALHYAAQGVPVFPCNPETKAPLIEADKDENGEPIVGTGGFYKATTDADRIRSWWTQWPDALIGMPTGPASGVDVLDLDLKNGKDGFAALPGWRDRSPVIVWTPSGGAHLWFKSDGTIPSTSGKIAPGIDTRGMGGYAIVPPSWNGKAAYYFANGNEGMRHELPPFPADLRAQLPELNERTPSRKGDASPFDLWMVAGALAVIPPSTNRDARIRVGMATFRATDGGEFGFEAWCAWLRKSGQYDPRAARKRWNGFSPNRIGAGTLIFLANEAQPGFYERRMFELMDVVVP